MADTLDPDALDILLDTHTLLWFAFEPEKLPVRVRRIIENPKSRKRISVASFWEMGIKFSIGNLPEAGNLLALEALCRSQGFEIVPISILAVALVSTLPFPDVKGRVHKDPFDRIIVATALTLGAPLLSRDDTLDAYAAKRVWE